MKITVKYMAQLKQAAGTGIEDVAVEQDCTVEALIRRLAERAALGKLLLGADAKPQRALLVFIGDEHVSSDSTRTLKDGDELTLLTPMAGG